MSEPLILFGAFDRHNLGDLLLARVAQRAAGARECTLAGLRSVDLSAVGGGPVLALSDVLTNWRARHGDVPAEILHVGGELLDTDAVEAAVMLLPQEAAAERIASLGRVPEADAAWAAERLGNRRRAPYVFSSREAPEGVRVVTRFRSVGGVGLAHREPAFVSEIVAALAGATEVSLRDATTQAILARHGLHFPLLADPVANAVGVLQGLVAEALAEGCWRPPAEDYLAVQCAASFGDDASLAWLAAALEPCGMPVVLFRAGLAPWHDDIAVLERLRARLRVPARVCGSAHIGRICALVAGARACVASSLHALLVASAFGVPATGIVPARMPDDGGLRIDGGEKLRAYASTWGVFRIVEIDRSRRPEASFVRSQIGL